MHPSSSDECTTESSSASTPEDTPGPSLPGTPGVYTSEGADASPDAPARTASQYARAKHKQRKSTVLKFLESWQVEVIILLMVFADLSVTGVEVGLDNELFCVGGEKLETAPHAFPQVASIESNQHGPVGKADGGGFAHVAAGSTSIPGPIETSDVPGRAASSVIVGGVTIPVLVHDKTGPGVLGKQAAGHGEGGHDEQGHGINIEGDHAAHYKVVCEGHHSPRILHLEHIFHWIGITILCLFQCEVCLKIWMEGWHFWTHLGHVCDFCVVTSSLLLELFLPWTLGYFVTRSSDVVADMLAALLLTLRALRILRLAHGLFTIANKQWVRSANMQRQLQEALAKNAGLRKENEKLESQESRSHGAPELVGLK